MDLVVQSNNDHSKHTKLVKLPCLIRWNSLCESSSSEKFAVSSLCPLSSSLPNYFVRSAPKQPQLARLSVPLFCLAECVSYNTFAQLVGRTYSKDCQRERRDSRAQSFLASYSFVFLLWPIRFVAVRPPQIREKFELVRAAVPAQGHDEKKRAHATLQRKEIEVNGSSCVVSLQPPQWR